MKDKKFLCKYCKAPLKYYETSDTEGDIFSGYVIEKQYWICKNCQKDYCIQIKANFEKPELISFKED